ncbi:MAG: hypothetical protein CVU05_15735 [Bacteroidetes bacterium HGW-Bacteroidetes-21]|nr:MAG: hypothetical protein CVU05_15735 [Bacteroidetes bacterium HGW-Bacteroidetes-21]
MSSNSKNEQTPSTLEEVGGALTRTEQYIENNKKRLSYIVGIIVVVVLAYIGYQKLYIAPMEKEAGAAMFNAEFYFEKDSFRLALDGDGQSLGFLDVIDQFGPSSSGNLATYYAGICYLQLGEFENAIEYLDSYSGNDLLVSSMATGALGDAYLEMGDDTKAIDKYMAAAHDNPNTFTTPVFLMKAGYLYEKQGKKDLALKVYEEIQKQYSKTNEGRKIDKYIARVKAQM